MNRLEVKCQRPVLVRSREVTVQPGNEMINTQPFWILPAGHGGPNCSAIEAATEHRMEN
jgi:hypothetical protein